MLASEQIDWSQCALVEVKARVQSGAPVLCGTRLPVNAIVDNAAYGMTVQEISKQFHVAQGQVEAILAYAKSHLRVRPKWFPYKGPVRACVAGLAGLVTLVSAIVSIRLAAACPAQDCARIGLPIFWGTWPPLWFLFEHYLWFDNWGDHEAVKRFQDGRQLWAKLWAGVGAVLAALLYKFCAHP